MSVTSEIGTALAEMIAEVGETVKIYGNTPGEVFSPQALVTGGSGKFNQVTGGFYDQTSYSISIPKTSLLRSDSSQFVPEPGMLVDARGKEMRIPDDGVTNFRAHFHVMVVGREVPA